MSLAVHEACGITPKMQDVAGKTPRFQITEYEQVGYPSTLRFRYQSGTMGLRDASRYAAALSYAMGEYVSVIAADPIEEPYYEWWYAGTLWRIGLVPPPRPEESGLTEVAEREIVEEGAEAAEDRRLRSVERSRRPAAGSGT